MFSSQECRLFLGGEEGVERLQFFEKISSQLCVFAHDVL